MKQLIKSKKHDKTTISVSLDNDGDAGESIQDSAESHGIINLKY